MANFASVILLITAYVFIYNLGIFLLARLYKVGVKKIYIWLTPGYSLFHIKIQNTQFGLGWLPLGGYIELSGIQMEAGQIPKAGDFVSKTLSQKLIIELSGPLLTFIIGLGICAVYLPIDKIAILGCFSYVLCSFIVFFLVTRTISVFFKPNKDAPSSSYLVVDAILLTSYIALLYFAIVKVNNVLPFVDDTIAIFKNPLSIRYQIAQLSTEGLIYFSGLLGIYSFFLNITPLTHTVGNHVLTLVYESLTNDKMLAYKMQKINTALDVLSLCFFLWFVYKFFF